LSVAIQLIPNQSNRRSMVQVILPPLVFTGKTYQGQTLAYCENYDRKRLYNTGPRVAEKGMTTANKVFLDACINIQDEQSQKYLGELNDLVSIF
jgi:hypothetical protein